MVAFIVLHYKSMDETLECLNTLKKLEHQEKIKIIVVSNSEIDSNFKKKITEYTKDIIINNENLGFAKANNVGCQYAIEKYKPDYLAVINNDLLIEQSNFIDLLQSSYDKYNFDILGPKIKSPSGESVNPFPVLSNRKMIENQIKKNEKIISIYKSKFKLFLFKIYHNIKYSLIKEQKLENGNKIAKNVALHGCCLIFSKKYYQKYRDIFDKRTFLYHEEEFLYFRMLKDNLCTIYDPKIVVFHKEGSSLNKIFDGKNSEKQIFRYTECNNSLRELLNYIDR